MILKLFLATRPPQKCKKIEYGGRCRNLAYWYSWAKKNTKRAIKSLNLTIKTLEMNFLVFEQIFILILQISHFKLEPNFFFKFHHFCFLEIFVANLKICPIFVNFIKKFLYLWNFRNADFNCGSSIRNFGFWAFGFWTFGPPLRIRKWNRIVIFHHFQKVQRAQSGFRNLFIATGADPIITLNSISFANPNFFAAKDEKITSYNWTKPNAFLFSNRWNFTMKYLAV